MNKMDEKESKKGIEKKIVKDIFDEFFEMDETERNEIIADIEEKDPVTLLKEGADGKEWIDQEVEKRMKEKKESDKSSS